MCLQPEDILADNDITAVDPSFKVVQYAKWWKKASAKQEASVANDKYLEEDISGEPAGEADALDSQVEEPVQSRWNTRPDYRFPSPLRARIPCNSEYNGTECCGCNDICVGNDGESQKRDDRNLAIVENTPRHCYSMKLAWGFLPTHLKMNKNRTLHTKTNNIFVYREETRSIEIRPKSILHKTTKMSKMESKKEFRGGGSAKAKLPSSVIGIL